MTVTFRTKKLQKQFERHELASKDFGEQVGRRYIQRIQLLRAAKSLDDVRTLPGLDCHPLKGNRAGQFAVKLTGFFRLIFSLQGGALDIICIEEVSKHYGD